MAALQAQLPQVPQPGEPGGLQPSGRRVQALHRQPVGVLRGDDGEVCLLPGRVDGREVTGEVQGALSRVGQTPQVRGGEGDGRAVVGDGRRRRFPK